MGKSVIKDKINERVQKLLSKRFKKGMDSYGIPISEAHKSSTAWLTDVQEELLDAVVYLEKLKDVL